jgi:hypothetical protein
MKYPFFDKDTSKDTKLDGIFFCAQAESRDTQSGPVPNHRLEFCMHHLFCERKRSVVVSCIDQTCTTVCLERRDDLRALSAGNCSLCSCLEVSLCAPNRDVSGRSRLVLRKVIKLNLDTVYRIESRQQSHS